MRLTVPTGRRARAYDAGVLMIGFLIAAWSLYELQDSGRNTVWVLSSLFLVGLPFWLRGSVLLANPSRLVHLATLRGDQLILTPWGGILRAPPPLTLPVESVRSVGTWHDWVVLVLDPEALGGIPRGWKGLVGKPVRYPGQVLVLPGPFREPPRLVAGRLLSALGLADADGPSEVSQIVNRAIYRDRLLRRSGYTGAMITGLLNLVYSAIPADSELHPLPRHLEARGIPAQVSAIHARDGAPVLGWAGIGWFDGHLVALVERGASEGEVLEDLFLPNALQGPRRGRFERRAGNTSPVGTGRIAGRLEQHRGVRLTATVRTALGEHLPAGERRSVEASWLGPQGQEWRWAWSIEVAPERIAPAPWTLPGGHRHQPVWPARWGGDEPPVRLLAGDDDGVLFLAGAPHAEGGRVLMGQLEAPPAGTAAAGASDPFAATPPGTEVFASQRPYFGRALDFAGSHLAVGYQGGIAVHRRDQGEWSEFVLPSPIGATPSAHFGAQLALCAEGRWLAATDEVDGERRGWRLLLFDLAQDPPQLVAGRVLHSMMPVASGPRHPAQQPSVAFAGGRLFVLVPDRESVHVLLPPDLSPHPAWQPGERSSGVPRQHRPFDALLPGEVVVDRLLHGQAFVIHTRNDGASWRTYYFSAGWQTDRSAWYGARMAVVPNGTGVALALPWIQRGYHPREFQYDGLVLVLPLPGD